MTYIINVYIDDDPVMHPDMESALREFDQRPTELSETIERTETGTLIWGVDEMAWMLRESQDDLAAEKRHNATLQAAE